MFRISGSLSPSPELSLLSIQTTVKEGGVITLPLSIEGKTAISLDEILNDPAIAEEKLQPLLDDMQVYGLSSALTNLIIAMPDEASELITQLMLMQQDGPTAAFPADNDADQVSVPAQPQATKAPGGGFMDVIRPTEAPAATEAPANPGFFGKPQ